MRKEQYLYLNQMLSALGWPASTEGEKFSEQLDNLVSDFYTTDPGNWVEDERPSSDLVDDSFRNAVFAVVHREFGEEGSNAIKRLYEEWLLKKKEMDVSEQEMEQLSKDVIKDITMQINGRE